ncbi:hypothetical protein BFP70_01545 [Thioclava sp. SK-1]|uniref:LysR substrate-binding domain-containing protein n=1 Tax=Thioclava sp. SK-1 TaxID=1889770 RepID=UPI000824BB98|nr:LysR substrate-binding domain-containing protein [Thioclava sp. SK-1]OCX61289.1 hypothetical protein BFP70_01545 [Thioclava sp. SK-1]
MNTRIKLRHLQAFVAISRLRSFKHAAKQLFLTQPAISRTMAELEDIVRCRLLVRDRSGVELTPQGAFFLSFADATLSALERGISGIGDFANDSGLHLRIGMQASVAVRVMPMVTAAVAQDTKDLRLSLVEGAHTDLVTRLRDGQLDVVLGLQGPPESMGDLSFTQIYTEALVIVAAPGHALQNRPELQKIIDWPVIYPPPEDPIRPAVRRFLVSAGVPLPPMRIETSSFAFGLSRTLEGGALWIAPQGLVAPYVARGDLIQLGIDMSSTAGPIGLMSRAGEDQTLTARLLLPILRDCLSDESSG